MRQEVQYIRYVIASSPDAAIRNAINKAHSYTDANEAMAEMQRKPHVFPAEVFEVYEVNLEAAAIR